jgi:hypothetical protein
MDLQKFVEDINKHISYYKLLTEEIAKEIIEYVKKQTNLYKIKISYEHVSVITKIKNYNEKLEKDQPAKIVRFKVVLATNKHKANFNTALARQCNGAVIVFQEQETGVVCYILARPSHEFNPKFTQAALLNHIVSGNYKVYQVQDGTLLNLYYDDNYTKDTEKWVFASKNSYDVANLFWRGFSYKDILQDVLKQYPEFQFSKLDKTKTYTIGFKHPAHHPFNQPLEWTDEDFTENRGEWIKKAWFVQSCEQTGVINTTEDIGLPIQQVTEEIKQIPMLFRRLDESLRDYVEKSRKDSWEVIRKDMFLGIILRATDPEKTGDMSDILLESSLWKEIRNLVYQLPFIPNKVVREKQEQNFKNMNYVILSSYVNFSKKVPFITVFPQFINHYKRYDKILDAVVEKIYDDMNTKAKKVLKKKDDAELQIVSVNTDDVLVEKIYSKFLDIIKTNYQITEKNSKTEKTVKRDPVKTDKKNIKAIITNLRYLDILYNLL